MPRKKKIVDTTDSEPEPSSSSDNESENELERPTRKNKHRKTKRRKCSRDLEEKLEQITLIRGCVTQFSGQSDDEPEEYLMQLADFKR